MTTAVLDAIPASIFASATATQDQASNESPCGFLLAVAAATAVLVVAVGIAVAPLPTSAAMTIGPAWIVGL